MSLVEHDRDPDARRPLTDAMTWGERQRLWMRVYKKERDRFERERDDAREQLRGAVEALSLCVDRLVHGELPGNAEWWDKARPYLRDGGG